MEQQITNTTPVSLFSYKMNMPKLLSMFVFMPGVGRGGGERISKDCDLNYPDFSLHTLTLPFSIAFSTFLILTRALGKLNNPSLAKESIL